MAPTGSSRRLSTRRKRSAAATALQERGEEYGATPIIFSAHAKMKMEDRGATEAEVIKAILTGHSEPARAGRRMYRKNFAYQKHWRSHYYAVKQVAPVVALDEGRLIVTTVFVYYF